MEEILEAKEELRLRIIKTASDLFFKYGIRTITMDEVASSIGISKRTLYQVFKDKEDLLLGCILADQDDMTAYVKDVYAKTDNVLEVITLCYKFTIKKFHMINVRFFEDLKRYPSVYEMFTRGRERDSNTTIEFFQKGVSQGLFRSDIDFEIHMLLVQAQMNVLLDSGINQKYSLALIYESIMFTFLRGISTAKGYEELENFIREYKDENNDLK